MNVLELIIGAVGFVFSYFAFTLSNTTGEAFVTALSMLSFLVLLGNRSLS